MNYDAMKEGYQQGWHTWNNRSVLSHVHMPDGLALNLAFKEYASGQYLKETLIGLFGENDEKVFPGPHSFDEKYTRLNLKWRSMEIMVESTVRDGGLILLATPVQKQLKPAMLVVETGYLWGLKGYIETVSENRAIAHGPDCDTDIFVSGEAMIDRNIPTQAAFLSVAFTDAVCVSTGSPVAPEKARVLLDEACGEVQRRYEKYGSSAELYAAMECALAWDTIYDPKHDRVISPVSRLWSINSGGYVLFCWDTFFAGYMAAAGGCKELAYFNAREILREGESVGFVPNFAYATGQISADRSQPIVGSAMVREIYRKYREKWFVKEMYPGLLAWNEWFAGHRSAASGALCWGSDPIPVQFGNDWEYPHHGVNGRYGAALESGLDNSPMYDDVPFDEEKHMLMLEDVGLTGLYIYDCRCLIDLAREIGREEDIPALEARMARAEEGMEGMWDEQRGFYYNRRTDTSEFSRSISPTNFYALFSERVSPERQRRIADEHYYNRDEFYGDWMLPSCGRNEPAYQEQNYWRGRVWAPLNFLVYLALQNTDLQDVKRDLAEKSETLFMKEWTELHHVHENYNSITGEGCDARNSDKFYHWGALLPLIAIAQKGYLPELGKPLGA
ncbi:MAG: hypothetical protein IJ048_10480 [Clostridia bacterium]|nr:hypothetical protein [Clostridia bacterium]